MQLDDAQTLPDELVEARIALRVARLRLDAAVTFARLAHNAGPLSVIDTPSDSGASLTRHSRWMGSDVTKSSRSSRAP
jgi:hypothetical protein